MWIAVLADQAHLHRDTFAALVGALSVASHVGVAQIGTLVAIKMHVHRVQRDYGGQDAGLAVSTHQVACRDQCTSGAACDGRTYLGERQIQLGGLDCGLGELHVGLGLIGGGVALLQLLGGGCLQRSQLLSTGRFATCQCGLRAGAGQVCFRASQSSTVTASVNLEQHVATFDDLALFVIDPVDVATHTWPQRNAFHRLDAAIELIP